MSGGSSAARARRGGHHGSRSRGRNRVAVEAATAEAISGECGDELGRGGATGLELGSVRPRVEAERRELSASAKRRKQARARQTPHQPTQTERTCAARKTGPVNDPEP